MTGDELLFAPEIDNEIQRVAAFTLEMDNTDIFFSVDPSKTLTFVLLHWILGKIRYSSVCCLIGFEAKKPVHACRRRQSDSEGIPSRVPCHAATAIQKIHENLLCLPEEAL